MDFNKWLNIGIKNKWCSVPYCETHDGSPLTNEEMDQLDESWDICINAVRLYEYPYEG